ncbi:MAG: MerR family transcriptional regulator [Micromonosporaceae bacterium]|nr:MerR family transcriptional regulator [Micromonosporaceae bacterium]
MDDPMLSIREVARRYGLSTSALRYYDELGLVTPAQRRGRQRWYGPPQLHRLAAIQIGKAIGLSLESIAALLDGNREVWTSIATSQIATLAEQIATARVAKTVLEQTLCCQAEHPIRDCPVLAELLRLWSEGTFRNEGTGGLEAFLAEAKAHEHAYRSTMDDKVDAG